jgi:hypothetical protein
MIVEVKNDFDQKVANDRKIIKDYIIKSRSESFCAKPRD